MNASTINSKRLRRVAAVLRSGQPASTLDITQATGTLAVSATIAELRECGWRIKCKCRLERHRPVWYYTAEKVPAAWRDVAA